MTPIAALARPTLTCTITACASPVTSQTPCAIATAAVSCGIVTGSGASSPSCARASITGGKSVPALANSQRTPQSASAPSIASAPVCRL